ncbi:hypothetical protein [Saccharothrix australiensis]|uniref:AAA+ ATPase domain-containing protein n=1 Tax=Saccharothrix australiensis TaxID=2072 RepID=A0A495W4S4_9PSEU|nr:hypothetical protein [Saccharothrix australiensis]RKT56691.1 hypothetical protein C8E97_5400 [Saccharothrix australiensis]
MEIHAQRVGVTGPHGPLLKPTSLRVPPGELVLVAGPPGAGHTAFGLVLSGRLRPGTGTVTPDAAELRGHVVLVDSPDVSEPEASLSLAGVVGEELAANRRRSGRKAVADWLAERGVDEHARTRFEYVPADVRCAVMLELGAGRPGARAVVLDSPDRYHGDPATWWRLAREHVRPDLSVVVLCTTTSAEVLGVPAARLGADNTAGEAGGGGEYTARPIGPGERVRGTGPTAVAAPAALASGEGPAALPAGTGRARHAGPAAAVDRAGAANRTGAAEAGVSAGSGAVEARSAERSRRPKHAEETRRAESGAPAEHTRRARPVTPAEQTQRAEPVTPAERTQRAEPVTPAERTQRAEPVTPAERTQRAEPVTPAEPAGAARPAHPAERGETAEFPATHDSEENS